MFMLEISYLILNPSNLSLLAPRATLSYSPTCNRMCISNVPTNPGKAQLPMVY